MRGRVSCVDGGACGGWLVAHSVRASPDVVRPRRAGRSGGPVQSAARGLCDVGVCV